MIVLHATLDYSYKELNVLANAMMESMVILQIKLAKIVILLVINVQVDLQIIVLAVQIYFHSIYHNV